MKGLGRGAILLASVASPLAAGDAVAGAWTMPQGQGQVTITDTMSSASKSFDSSRALNSTPTYRKIEAGALIEYGVSNKFTLMTTPSFQAVDIAGPNGASRSGLGYTEFGARYRVWENGTWVLSAQGLARIPGTHDQKNPAAVGYTDPEYDARALLGKSFTLNGMGAFVDLEAAQRFRNGDPPNEFRFDATFGLNVAPKWTLLAQSFTVVSEGAGIGPAFVAYDYSKLQLSAVYSLTPDWSVQFGGYVTVLGRNALQENGIVLGLWRKF